jgi:hypothetical protein
MLKSLLSVLLSLLLVTTPLFADAADSQTAGEVGGPWGVPDFQAPANIQADQVVKFPRNPTD